MSVPKQRNGCGIKTLEDMRQRCRIDEETGCWNWAMAVSRSTKRNVPVSPRVWMPDRSTPGGGALMTAGRAAWLLAGKWCTAGRVVYRAVCHNELCINPEHGKCLTRREMFEHLKACGVNRGDPERAVINRQNMLKMVTPVERVRQAEAMLREGVMSKDIRAALGISNNTMTRIRAGTHMHSVGFSQAVRGASIFTLGAPVRDMQGAQRP